MLSKCSAEKYSFLWILYYAFVFWPNYNYYIDAICPIVCHFLLEKMHIDLESFLDPHFTKASIRVNNHSYSPN